LLDFSRGGFSLGIGTAMQAMTQAIQRMVPIDME
jgi:hypothetical protein